MIETIAIIEENPEFTARRKAIKKQNRIATAKKVVKRTLLVAGVAAVVTGVTLIIRDNIEFIETEEN